MFIRLDTSKRTKNPIVQIIESYRQNGKVKQRIVASLGAVSSEKDLQSLEKLASDLILKLEAERYKQASALTLFPGLENDLPKPSRSRLVDPKNLIHKDTIFDGFNTVICALLQECGFSKVRLSSARTKAFHSHEVLQLLLARMWNNPSSKRRSHQLQKEHGFSGIDLQDIYRFMDQFTKREKQIKTCAFKALYGELKPHKIDCIFVDVTTLYFESICDDELRAFGFSKDQKFHSVQVVLCLVVNSDGIPLTFKVFRGNTAEVRTLLPVLKEIKEEFLIDKVTVVGDRGMTSLENIKAIAGIGFSWICASKIKKLPKELRLNDLSTFSKIGAPEHERDCEEMLYKIVDHPNYPNSSLLVTHSPKRAKKDLSDRERILARLEAKIGAEGEISRRPKKLVTNNGYKQFVRFTEPGKWELNRIAIAEASAWDGFHGISFSKDLKLPVEQILFQYKALWRVEEAFRISKTYLKIRPIYHWAPQRIHAHILISFVSLFLERYLEMRLRNARTPLTPERIRDALKTAHSVHLLDPKTKQHIIVPSRLSADAKIIFSLLSLNIRRITIVQ